MYLMDNETIQDKECLTGRENFNNKIHSFIRLEMIENFVKSKENLEEKEKNKEKYYKKITFIRRNTEKDHRARGTKRRENSL